MMYTRRIKENFTSDWGRFQGVKRYIKRYFPVEREPENKLEQAAMALKELIYNWVTYKDVFDNHVIERGPHDVSGSANWLYKNIPETREILNEIFEISYPKEYSDLLIELANLLFEEEEGMLEILKKRKTVGNPYVGEGPFSVEDPEHTEEDLEYSESYDDEDDEIDDGGYWPSGLGESKMNYYRKKLKESMGQDTIELSIDDYRDLLEERIATISEMDMGRGIKPEFWENNLDDIIDMAKNLPIDERSPKSVIDNIAVNGDVDYEEDYDVEFYESKKVGKRFKESTSLDWDSFNQFEKIMEPYFPHYDEGVTKASQLTVAISKLVYRYFNDGDVFDSDAYEFSSCGDSNMASYANWIYENFEESRRILDTIKTYDCEYIKLLYDLCEELLSAEKLKELNQVAKVGSIYDEDDGPFSIEEDEDEDDDEY